MHGGSPWLLLTAVMAVQDVFIGNFPHGIGFIALRANLAKSSYFFGAKISIGLPVRFFFNQSSTDLTNSSSDLTNFVTALFKAPYFSTQLTKKA